MNSQKLIATLIGTCLVVTTSWALPKPENDSLPFVGTGAHGHTYPGATVPFGMVQLSPDTRTRGWDGCSGYHYSDSTIQGFSHTHLSGTGAACLGDILLMPTVGEVQLDAGSPGNGYVSKFSHDQEEATPGYYRVFLETPRVTAELTASERCGFHKYTFPASDQSHFILDLVHGIGNRVTEASLRVENQNTISGSRISNGWGGRRAVYFVMEFSKPFESFGIEHDGTRLGADAHDAQGRDLKAFFNYKTSDKEVVYVKVGISGTGIEGARKNLAAEIPKWDFAGTRAAAVKQWKKIFDSVQVQAVDPHVQRTFYANLYLACLAPVLFNDVDGNYMGYDHQIHAANGFQNYTTFSIWDIYRAEWPLLTLMQPARVNDMVQSMLTEHPQYGQHTVPIWPLWGNETWCMIGYHSADMITEAYLEGYRNFDAEAAYQAMRDTAMQDRNGLDTYKHLGYVASTPNGAATSRTLEYTFDDWCIAKMAETLGHQDDAKLFYQRAANYYNLFDRSTEFFRGRKADGEWRTPFSPISQVNDEYTEADAWQYAFAIQQDVPGMIALYGGNDGFVSRMDALFTANSKIDTGIPDITGLIGQDSQGDEQCHHVPYLYDYAGAPYKTQEHVRQIMSTLYNDTPEGECGNADCGEMCAWYVFSALGFYPMNPASGVYAIGSPVVKKAVLHLDGEKFKGHTFTVISDGNSAKNIYVQSATLNGKPLNRPWITRDEVTSGGTLRLVMGPNANTAWGSAMADRPPATMPAGFQYPSLPAPPEPTNQVVKSPLPIRIACGSSDAIGKFSADLDNVDGDSNHADSEVDTSVPHAAPAAVYQNERYGSDFTYSFPLPREQSYLVRLHFAEVFDDGAGNRIENIYINGQPVLTNFDVFVAAGGMNKALVKDFTDVTPDGNGRISIRITATPTSPDQNAKISAIEILKPGSTDSAESADQPKPFVVTTTDGKTTIAINTAAAPELEDWAEHKLAPVLAEWYPKIAAMLPSPDYTAPTNFTVTVKEMRGVAYTAGRNISVSKKWIHDEMDKQAVGSLVHEAVHVVQQYHGRHNPGWLVEGLADYVRWFIYEPQSHGADIVWMRRQGKNFEPRYDASYRVTADFLNWATAKYDSNLVSELNAAMREGKYSDDIWKEHAGKTAPELGAEWKQQVEAQLHPPAAADKQVD